jgi:hypothetical protein
MKTVFKQIVLMAGISLLPLCGCAPTSVAVTNQYTGPLPQPQRILVYNFAVSPDEVKIDQGVPAQLQGFVNGPQTPRTADELKVGRAVSDALAKKLAAQIRKLGYPADRAAGTPPFGGENVLAIEGHIISVDEGNRAERVVVGLGVGRSDVKTITRIFDVQPSGRRLVEEFNTDAKSGFKPGMAETEGASAIAGHWAVGLVVGAGLNVASETFSANVEADADRTAKDIAKQLNTYFQSKGWIPTLPQE